MLQSRSGLEAEIAHADVGVIEAGVGVVDGLGAALFAARPDASLDTYCARILIGTLAGGGRLRPPGIGAELAESLGRV